MTDRPAFRVCMSSSGVLDGLTFQPVARKRPGPGEIEVEVRTLGLNLREVLKALDCYAGDEVDAVGNGTPGAFLTFDGDCAGRVAAVGPDVKGFVPGDEMVGFGLDVFGSFATIPAAFAVQKPAHLSFEEAATIPLVFMTAYHALHHIGRIKKGDKILIHAAAGGVGLAAVQLSQLAGAEVFATAGSDTKREFLHGLGVRHVMSSRTFDFADEILRITNGGGVDLVLNALAGEFIPKSLSVLAPFGRFLEIGKRDIYDNTALGLYPFRRNLTFSAIDLLQMTPEMVGGILQEVMQFVERGTFKPLQHRTFSITDVAGAFRHMRRANHIGKIVIALDADVTG